MERRQALMELLKLLYAEAIDRHKRFTTLLYRGLAGNFLILTLPLTHPSAFNNITSRLFPAVFAFLATVCVVWCLSRELNRLRAVESAKRTIQDEIFPNDDYSMSAHDPGNNGLRRFRWSIGSAMISFFLIFSAAMLCTYIVIIC